MECDAINPVKRHSRVHSCYFFVCFARAVVKRGLKRQISVVIRLCCDESAEIKRQISVVIILCCDESTEIKRQISVVIKLCCDESAEIKAHRSVL